MAFVWAVASLSAQWQPLANTKLSSVCPGGPTACSAVVGAWSGATMDTSRNRLIIWGGGHGDYDGNEVYSLNLSANPPTLTRIKDSSTPNPDPTQCIAELADGNPNGRHTYNALAYIASEDRMYVERGSLSCNAGSQAGDTWTLDLSALTWLRMDPASGSPKPADYAAPSGNGPVTSSAYDPNTGLVFHDIVGVGFWKYLYSTNTYTRLTTNVGTPFNSTMVLDPYREYLYYFGSTDGTGGNATTSLGTASVRAIDISAGSSYTMEDWTGDTSGCDGLSRAYYPGLAYDPVTHKIVGWPNFGNTVYLFNPDTKVCTTETFEGGPPDSVNASSQVFTTGTFGRFAYSAPLDAFVVVNHHSTDAYLLRLRSNANALITGSTFRGSIRMK